MSNQPPPPMAHGASFTSPTNPTPPSCEHERYPPPNLVPATPGDCRKLGVITAIASSPDLYVRLVTPNLNAFATIVEKGLLNRWRDPNPALDVRVTKALSPTGEIMGYIGLSILEKDYKSDNLIPLMSLLSPSLPSSSSSSFQSLTDEGVDEFPCREGLFDKLVQDQEYIFTKWIKGRRAIAIKAVYVLPSFQRRGVGSALLKWANDLADQEKVPSYLEATPFGYPLYKTFGFNVIAVHDYQLAKWALGGPDGFGWGIYTLRAMLRLPEV